MRVELETGLDDPDGVRRGAGRDACDGGGSEVDPRVLLAVVEGVGDDLLAVAVREEVDGPRGDDADEGGPEALEQRARGLFAVDVPAGTSESAFAQGGRGEREWEWMWCVPDDVHSLDEMPEQISPDGDDGGAIPLYADPCVLRAEHVRL